MDQLNLFFHFLRGRFEVTCLQYMLEVLIWGQFVHIRLILLLIVNNFLQTSPTQNWMELSHITQHMVQILQNYAVLCSVCHFFHESMVFEILNSKYNLFVVDWLPANRSIMQPIEHEDTVFFSEWKIQLTHQGNFLQ